MVTSCSRWGAARLSLTLMIALAGCEAKSGDAPASFSDAGAVGNADARGYDSGDAALSMGTGGSGIPGSGGSPGSASGGTGVTASGGDTASGGAVGSGSGGSSDIASGGTTGAGSGGTTGAGSGGRSGTGGLGTGGASASTGGAAGGSAGQGDGRCPSNAIFCADFESGTIPAQATFFPEYLRASMATYLTVDATTGLNGGHAAKFVGTSFSQMLGVVTGTSAFWTRVYLRSDVDMGTVTGHATYVAATDGNGDPNMGEQIRVGEHTCQLELNRRSDDKELLSNGGKYMCMGGIVLAKNTWYCLETFYNGPGREVRVFVAGTESAPLHATDWGPYNYGMFKFGFENYSSPMRTMWYDDVAIAPQRIGCH
ncbi:MAG: hypothetical protein ABIS92_07155 [Polyangia bacterium]